MKGLRLFFFLTIGFLKFIKDLFNLILNGLLIQLK